MTRSGPHSETFGQTLKRLVETRLDGNVMEFARRMHAENNATTVRAHQRKYYKWLDPDEPDTPSDEEIIYAARALEVDPQLLRRRPKREDLLALVLDRLAAAEASVAALVRANEEDHQTLEARIAALEQRLPERQTERPG